MQIIEVNFLTVVQLCICRELLRLFINPELIKWSGLCDVYEKELKQGSAKVKATQVFAPNTEDGQKRWKDLRSRVVEHVSVFVLLRNPHKCLSLIHI